MNRPDLHSAFTKINLWKQTQFRKIVYLDADVVAYRAPDELFDIPHAFSAAPDIGWPDLFNTGVMVLTPNMGDFYAMMAMAERGISFDGADQGLLNMYFKNSYNRLSFAYNVTPSAHYQYIPAYKHFQSTINMVHFIGSDKPWAHGRNKFTGTSPFDEMVGRWWAVYDRHYRREATPSQPSQSAEPESPVPEIVQYFVKGEYQPKLRYNVPVGQPRHDQSSPFHGQQYQPPPPDYHHPVQPEQQYPAHYDHYDPPPPPEPQHHHHHQHDGEPHDQHHVPQHHYHDEQSQPGSSIQDSEHPAPTPSVSFRSEEETHTEAREEQAPEHQNWAPQAPPSEPEHKPEPYRPAPADSWDAQRQPPPSDSKPEAFNFPQTHYEMSSDLDAFVPPERYPSPPKDMWYEVPKEPPANPREKPRQIFPWESQQPRATRVFRHQEEPESPVAAPSTESHQETEPSLIESTAGQKSEPQTPTTPTLHAPAPVPWSSFPRTNAWDDVPEIGRYVDAIQKHRRGRSQGAGAGGLPELGEGWERRGSRVTDFPSEDDRPSLPVTPAPIRRQSFWGGGGPGLGLDGEDDEGQLPAAEGVPAQSDWVCVHGRWWTPADCLCDLTNILRYYKDPVAQLQKLAKQQSEALLQRLGGSGALGDDVIGTEGKEIPSRSLPYGTEDAKSPTYVPYSPPVVSPKPVKPDSGSSSVRSILEADHETGYPPANPILAPSYQGPGMTFEKGEDVATFETPALPTDEDLDVLQT
ncbi:hypothetical protein B0T26DRAFT_639303 [Lasiosphaeria miniovina]|uniref:glycogenin glucosyltransferase n=1 Tax=Lasiosphaeria miniovina TaxID=1954250 RepID=A0AA40B5A5_9PEZI|nr:uncharacterized protein B0T26DRAFT_639303 [Lasiosphaeria miniovina]KAK0727961.1 hypothetical protein B0T26DRAFT_639303 [Lasiosphaeria miniovina]